MIERVYRDALARPVARRPGFVAEACGGDDELRREIESLLASAEGVLDRPRVSPDDRWIAFRKSGKSFVTRIAPGRPPAEETWAGVEIGPLPPGFDRSGIPCGDGEA